MSDRETRRIARYKPPTDDECVELLDDAEFRLATTPRLARLRGRSKAWEIHRQTGPYGRICALGEGGALGDYLVLDMYTSSSQITYLVAKAARATRAKFSCKQERSLIDGEIIGVRVTLTEFVSE